MEKQTAMHIVGTLAQGIDPHSGEAFAADSPYQHPDTVRALFLALQALADAERGSPQPAGTAMPQRTRPGLPENAGKPWSDEEDQTLAAGFDAGKPIPELARNHRRTRAAIQARLVRLGRMEPSAAIPRYPISASVAQAAPVPA